MATALTLQFPIVERTHPWAWYADPTSLRRESERIFGRAWQYVGHTGQVTERRLLSESEQLVAHFQALTRQALERSRLG